MIDGKEKEHILMMKDHWAGISYRNLDYFRSAHARFYDYLNQLPTILFGYVAIVVALAQLSALSLNVYSIVSLAIIVLAALFVFVLGLYFRSNDYHSSYGAMKSSHGDVRDFNSALARMLDGKDPLERDRIFLGYESKQSERAGAEEWSNTEAVMKKNRRIVFGVYVSCFVSMILSALLLIMDSCYV